MAIMNYATQLRRKNATGSSDRIFYASIFDLVQVSLNDNTKLPDVLAQKMAISNINLPVGNAGPNTRVPGLDSNLRIHSQHLPAWLITGVGKKPIGTIAAATIDLSVTSGLAKQLVDYASSHGLGSNLNALAGSYWIAQGPAESQFVDITWNNDIATQYFVFPGDEGVTSSPIRLERGDLLVFKDYAEGSIEHQIPNTFSFMVINNTYNDATDELKGVVKLSNVTVLPANPDNDVITEAILKGLIGTSAGKIAAGDHNHASLYLGISANAASASKWANSRTITLTGDASGSVSIDGSTNVSLNVDLANVLANKPNIYIGTTEPAGLAVGDYWLEIIAQT